MDFNHKRTYKVREFVEELFDNAGWYYESYTDYMEGHIQLYEVWPQVRMGSSKAFYLPFYFNEVIIEVVD